MWSACMTETLLAGPPGEAPVLVARCGAGKWGTLRRNRGGGPGGPGCGGQGGGERGREGAGRERRGGPRRWQGQTLSVQLSGGRWWR